MLEMRELRLAHPQSGRRVDVIQSPRLVLSQDEKEIGATRVVDVIHVGSIKVLGDAAQPGRRG